MTHDELLARIDAWNEDYYQAPPLYHALRAVVELHKPHLFGVGEVICSGCSIGAEWAVSYPCDTIQTIEKGLK